MDRKAENLFIQYLEDCGDESQWPDGLPLVDIMLVDGGRLYKCRVGLNADNSALFAEESNGVSGDAWLVEIDSIVAVRRRESEYGQEK